MSDITVPDGWVKLEAEAATLIHRARLHAFIRRIEYKSYSTSPFGRAITSDNFGPAWASMICATDNTEDCKITALRIVSESVERQNITETLLALCDGPERDDLVRSYGQIVFTTYVCPECRGKFGNSFEFAHHARNCPPNSKTNLKE